MINSQKVINTGIKVSIAHAIDAFLTEIVPFRGSLRLSKLLTRMIVPTPANGKIIVKTRQGFVMSVEPSIDIGVDEAIYYNGTDEIGTVRLMQRMLAPGIGSWM